MHKIFCSVVVIIVIMLMETAFSADTLIIIRTKSDGDTGSLQNTTVRNNSLNANIPKFRFDYKYVPETGYFYKTHRSIKYYSGAIDTCKSEGAELAMPRTAEEATELVKQFREEYTAVWIGLHDLLSERYFITLDGKSVNGSFINWSTGYPVATCDCHCAIMNNSTVYFNVNCESTYYFICSKALSTIQNPPTYNAYGEVHSSKNSIDRQKTTKHPMENTDTLSDTIQLNNESSINEKKTLSTKPHPPKFRNDYKYVAESGFYYKAQYGSTFKNAASSCAAEGAQLAIPKSESEAAILIKQFNDKNVGHWVGIHDLFAEGEFLTLDGVPLSESYINWKPHYPQYNRDDLDCVVIDSQGFYYDVNCETSYYFVCAKHESTIHTNNLCDTYDKAYVYSSEADRCYKLHAVASTWKNAMKLCRQEQSNLVEINSAAEAKILTEMLINSNGGVLFNKTFIHVDFNSLLIPDTYVTSSTKTLAEVGYEVWGEGEPNKNGGNERCGGMLMNGKLADVNCDTRALFICEKIPGYLA